MVVGWAPWWTGQTERTTLLTVGEHAGTLCSAYGLELRLRALDLTGAWTGESAANLDALVESVIAELS